ncbi:hypothetical protein A4X13_0g5326 [Tilletia indica]|uniref:N-acetylgalactosaminide beta-1,3-galactosyltransferase n=1 Tax=Tilletia indica TaxID=43049 RepID=A0A177T7M2_9BASI|nr:hypothetical protein A4X13_0g5326 [Tilletia indica]
MVRSVEYLPLGQHGQVRIHVPKARSGGKRRGIVGGLIVLLLLLAIPLLLLVGGSSWPVNAFASASKDASLGHFRGAATIRPINDRAVLMYKTGHSVIYDRIPIQFVEPRPDIPNRMIYSDVPLQIAGFPVIDALANLTDLLGDSPAFGEYNRLQKAHKNGENVAATTVGWDLDRFKFAPLMTHAWKSFPNATWFVTIDGDSFLFWSTLLHWLERYFDRPEYDHWYLGYDEMADETRTKFFAHGGAGFVVSRGLVDALHKDDPDGHAFHRNVNFNLIGCGDCAMGAVIADVPGRNGHTDAGRDLFHHDGLDKLIFRPRLWHTYVLSLHHNSPAQLNLLRNWEKRFLPSIPEWDGVRQCDVLYGLTPTFLRDPLQAYIRASDNVNKSRTGGADATAAKQVLARLNRTVIQPGWKADEVDRITCEGACLEQYGRGTSAEKCDRACDAHESCYGWQLSQASCTLAINGFRIGTPVDSRFQISTAWRLDRIAALERGMPCSDPAWRNATDARGHGLRPGRSDQTQTGLDKKWKLKGSVPVSAPRTGPWIKPQGPIPGEEDSEKGGVYGIVANVD